MIKNFNKNFNDRDREYFNDRDIEYKNMMKLYVAIIITHYNDLNLNIPKKIKGKQNNKYYIIRKNKKSSIDFFSIYNKDFTFICKILRIDCMKMLENLEDLINKNKMQIK